MCLEMQQPVVDRTDSIKWNFYRTEHTNIFSNHQMACSYLNTLYHRHECCNNLLKIPIFLDSQKIIRRYSLESGGDAHGRLATFPNRAKPGIHVNHDFSLAYRQSDPNEFTHENASKIKANKKQHRLHKTKIQMHHSKHYVIVNIAASIVANHRTGAEIWFFRWPRQPKTHMDPRKIQATR